MYVCGGLVVHLFVHQQHQINSLKKSIERLDLELEERDANRADREDIVDNGLDGVVVALKLVRKLRKRVTKLEKNVETKMDDLQKNVTETLDVMEGDLHDVLNRSIITINELDTKLNSVGKNQRELYDLLGAIHHRLDKMLVEEIPDRQLSPETVFTTSNGMPVHLVDVSVEKETHNPYHQWRIDDGNASEDTEMEYFDH